MFLFSSGGGYLSAFRKKLISASCCLCCQNDSNSQKPLSSNFNIPPPPLSVNKGKASGDVRSKKLSPAGNRKLGPREFNNGKHPLGAKVLGVLSYGTGIVTTSPGQTLGGKVIRAFSPEGYVTWRQEYKIGQANGEKLH